MSLNEADTRAKLIDPVLHDRGWNEDWIRREETAGRVQFIGSLEKPRRAQKRIDYVLNVMVKGTLMPVALLEAKPESAAPSAGLEQAKTYARLHHVPLAYSSNGHQFVEHDLGSGRTTKPRRMAEFPTWETVRDRYCEIDGIDFESDAAAPLLVKPRPDDRYYQRAAVRAVLSHLARGEKRALLSLATGTGKTRIAVRLLKALADAGQLKRALFVCDRNELRNQALSALQDVFGADAAAAGARNPEKNARVVVATYQTLDVQPDDDESYLMRHYGENYFSHIVIDECHRSAWGDWHEVLERNPNAVQIGLTATPRSFEYGARPDDVDRDEIEPLKNDNYAYFGDPVFEYGINEAMDDGYLAAMRLEPSTLITADQIEREEGIAPELLDADEIRDAITGLESSVAEMPEKYAAGSIEDRLRIVERVEKMCGDLFQRLLASGGPCQKTLIFCASDDHADKVAAEMGNLYAEWCNQSGERRADLYAFKCTAKGGSEHLATFKGTRARAFIACTVDLISTGVDVPRLQNVVFFRYLKSPILFHQMLGRGTRIHSESDKLHFTIYDYTNASRLLDVPLASRVGAPADLSDEPVERAPIRTFEVRGVEVRIEPDGIFILVPGEGGELERISIADYRERITDALLAEVDGLDEFRERWIQPQVRADLMTALPGEGSAVEVYRAAAELTECDLYDVLANLGWDETPRRRVDRADHFLEVEYEWRNAQGERPARVMEALAQQFGAGGTEELESQSVGQMPQVHRAGGLRALESARRSAAEMMIDLKRKLLVADTDWQFIVERSPE